MKPVAKYCAVYTRKSSDEGLDQEFNSLNAQREACLAYIVSQKSEGWIPIADQYDDGGFSGGNMERPALKRLLEDIKAGKVNIVVVYKIDRLTRSLMDFSKLVEAFDAHGVTFVSVTQSFNTTTSMGRLTLNVLLSFAQFEREITAERIRDKFAASKQKGIWMGGTLPTGYGVENRQLFVKEDEAQFVRMIYEEYSRLGSTSKLMMHLDAQGIRSPIRTRANGTKVGGYKLTTGAIFHILKNPIYIGKIKHKHQIYDGHHKAIISQEMWDTVQEKLKRNTSEARWSKQFVTNPKMLQGKIFDMEGNKYTPVHTKKRNIRYKYYVSQSLIKYQTHPKGIIARIPAVEIEGFVQKVMRDHLCDARKLAALLQVDLAQHSTTLMHVADNYQSLTHSVSAIKKMTVDVELLTIEICVSELCRYIGEVLEIDLSVASNNPDVRVTLPFHVKKAKKGTIVIRPGKVTDKPADIFDLPPADLKNLVRGVAWRDEHFKGKTIRDIAVREGLSEGFVGRLIHSSVEFR